MSISIGQKAPDFTLKASSGKDVSLAELNRNKQVVLLFFPFAFSGVSTDLLSTARDNMKMFSALDSVIAAISVDSFYSLAAFKKAHNFNFTLLSDFNKSVSGLYGCLYDCYLDMRGVAKISAFVIGKEGNIKYAQVNEDSSAIPDLKTIQMILAGA